MKPPVKWPKPIVSPGLRGAAQEVLQSKGHKRLMRLLGLLPSKKTTGGTGETGC